MPSADDCVRGGSRGRRRGGFTLIELLVVVSIIALLISILLPSLRRARDGAKLTVCGANLSQIGLGIITYAGEQNGLIPRGPACAGPFDFACAALASNQLWIGAANPDHPREPNGLGALLNWQTTSKKVYFCPADDNRNEAEELPRIGSELDAYGSYTYRQLDHLPDGRARGTLADMGVNAIGSLAVRVEALAFDTNSLGPGEFHHTNHKARRVNVLYRDRSVRVYANSAGFFSIPADTFASPLDIPARLDQILVNADYGYRNSPDLAPQIQTAD